MSRELINQRRKEKYELLRRYGYDSKEANKLKDLSARKLAKILNIKVVELKKELELWQEKNHLQQKVNDQSKS